MNDVVRTLAIVLVAAGAGAVLGWYLNTSLARRRLRRKQRFLGLPDNSECLLVVGRDAGVGDGAVARNDVFALLELSALIKDCGANAQLISADTPQQGFGERTEFCIGGPANRRMAAHMHSLLPGFRVSTDTEPGPDRGAFTIGSERYRLESGTVEHVLLARLTAGQEARPVFLACGQRSVTNQAAARYLARNHAKLARKHGANGTFCLLLKVMNSQAYGPDVVELTADVTRAATSPPPATPALESGTGRKHRAAN